MSALDTIRALSRGDASGAGGLLPACRAQAFGAEAFGPAAIAELFGRNPCPISATPAVVAGATALSLCDADAEGREQGWMADLHDGRIARLWRVGEGEGDAQAEPALAFAFDAFLSQDREPVALRPEDHPELPPDAAAALLTVAGQAALGPDADSPAAQGRAFVVRALSVGDRGSALVCVQGPEFLPRLCIAAFRHAGRILVHSRLIWDATRSAPSRSGL